MEDETVTLSREARREFIGRQLQYYREENSRVREVINKVLRVERAYAGHDFLEAMWSLFDALRMVTEFLGKLPLISADSAEMAWSELHEAPLNVLDGEGFDQFRYIIEVGFKMPLNASVQSSDIRQRVERIFAMILRMIQIEFGKNERSQTVS